MEQKENDKKLDESLEQIAAKPEEQPKSKFNPKILIFGLPIFVIQLIAVYFITANILMKKMWLYLFHLSWVSILKIIFRE